jgi:RNA polymerase sigma-70 factor, ECF subfamily
MNEQERHALFSELVTRHRSELYGYIFAVVRSWQDADDLFQSVCVVLWSKFDSFQPGTNFFAWARQTAKNKISKFLRHKQQPQFINEGVLDTLTEVAVGVREDWAEAYQAALRHCRAKLAAADEELIELHYGEGIGTRQIADRLQRPQQSICRSLNRIRAWLFECIQREMAREESSRQGRP